MNYFETLQNRSAFARHNPFSLRKVEFAIKGWLQIFSKT